MNIHQILDKASKLKIAVIGDYIEDRHLRGTVERVSPEAPVLIVANPDETRTAGGAGNVFINLCNLGVETHLFCNATDPFRASQVLDHVNGHTWINQNSNAVKTRVMSGNHHLLRLDTEIPYDQIEWLPFNQFSWWRQLERSISEFDCIVFADYHKGCVSDSLINGVMELATMFNVPVVVDAKKDFHRYKGATVLKCNEKEQMEWWGNIKFDDPRPLSERMVYSIDQFKNFICTYGDKGIGLSMMKEDGGKRIGFEKGHHVHIVDVCGAGDTVTAILALIFGMDKESEFPAINACKLANIAAAEVCSHPGVHSITKEELIKRYNEVADGRQEVQ